MRELTGVFSGVCTIEDHNGEPSENGGNRPVHMKFPETVPLGGSHSFQTRVDALFCTRWDFRSQEVWRSTGDGIRVFAHEI